MVVKSFEGQVTRMGWEPGARPRPELVEAVLLQHGRAEQRDLGPAVLGVITGGLTGVLFKAAGPGTEAAATLTGDLALVAVGLSLAAVAGAIAVARQHPTLLHIAAVHLLALSAVALS